jgi:hypothetical protein
VWRWRQREEGVRRTEKLVAIATLVASARFVLVCKQCMGEVLVAKIEIVL